MSEPQQPTPPRFAPHAIPLPPKKQEKKEESEKDYIVSNSSKYGPRVTSVLPENTTGTLGDTFPVPLGGSVKKTIRPERTNTPQKPNRLISVFKKTGAWIGNHFGQDLNSNAEIEFSLGRLRAKKDQLSEDDYEKLKQKIETRGKTTASQNNAQVSAPTISKPITVYEAPMTRSTSKVLRKHVEKPLFEDTTFGQLATQEGEPLEHDETTGALPSMPTLTEVVDIELPDAQDLTPVKTQPLQQNEIKKIPEKILHTKKQTTMRGAFSKTLSDVGSLLGLKKKPLELTEQEINAQFRDPAVALNEIHDIYTSTTQKREQANPVRLEKKEFTIERITRIEKSLTQVRSTTQSLRESTTLEKIGEAGMKFIATFDRGADFLKKNVDTKTRVLAGAGLLATAGISLYAAPVFATAVAISAVGAGMRIVSASGTYITFRGLLETMYEKKAKEGKAFNALEKTLLGTSAVLGSAALGQAFGQIFEHFFPAEKITEVLNQVTTNTAPIVPDMPSPAHTPLSSMSTQVTPTLETIVTPDTQFVHKLVKGDSLWSLLRADLTRTNFEGFTTLTQGQQETYIQKFVDKIDVPSGNKNLIRVGDTVDFSKYFK